MSEESERREIERTQSAVVQNTANRVALEILSSRTGVEALWHIAEAARTLAGAEYAALGVARPDGKGLLEFVTTGISTEAIARIGHLPRGAGILGLLLQRDHPLRIDDLSTHPSSVGFPKNHPPMKSFLGVPIRRSNSVLGSLYLTNKQGGTGFTEADVEAVEAIGSYAAVAIHNLLLLSRQRALISGLINAQEEERRAVAYDLHDGLTQYVMAAHAHLEAAKRARHKNNVEREEQEQEQGLRFLKEAVIESRRLVNGLRALALDDLGLVGAVEQLLVEEKARANWPDTEFIHNIAGRRFDKVMETAVFRVVQEALTNARKHAEAKKVRLRLLYTMGEDGTEPTLLLEVRDWGKGFTPEEQVNIYEHIGLQGMFERVSVMGGSHNFISVPGEGTTVRATFPAPDVLEEVE